VLGAFSLNLGVLGLGCLASLYIHGQP